MDNKYTASRAEPMALLREHGDAEWRVLSKSADDIEVEVYISKDARVFEGHYPRIPIFPGVYLLELAQQLRELHDDVSSHLCRLRGIHSMRLLSPVYPERWITCKGRRLTKFSHAEEDVWQFVFFVEGKESAKFRLNFKAWDVEAITDVEDLDHEQWLPDAMALKSYGAHDILSALWHRQPILLVDRVLNLIPDHGLVAEKLISLNEPCYRRIQVPERYRLSYPVSLMAESFIQAAALFMSLGSNHSESDVDKVMLLASLSKVRLAQRVMPGAHLRHYVKLERELGENTLLSGRSYVGDECVADYGQLVVVQRSQDVLLS